MAKISVLIRNKNESEYIGFAIQSIIDHIGSDNCEIIVIDNKSTDDSLDVVNLFNNRVDISIHNINNYSPGLSLNKGISLSKYDTILVMSAHFQITKFNHSILEHLFDEDICALFGKQIPIYRGKKITPRYIWEHFGNERIMNMKSDIEKRPFLHNAFCFYQKNILEKYPFDESLPGKEDRYWAKDCIYNNMNYLYLPEFEGNHFWTTNGATWKGL